MSTRMLCFYSGIVNKNVAQDERWWKRMGVAARLE